jgi:hypothetical protein
MSDTVPRRATNRFDVVVLVREVDPLQPFLGDRHGRHRGIDLPFLQARHQGGELERNELALDLERGAERPRDLDVETLEFAFVVAEAERRPFVLNPGAQQRIICYGGPCEPDGRQQNDGRGQNPHPHAQPPALCAFEQRWLPYSDILLL